MKALKRDHVIALRRRLHYLNEVRLKQMSPHRSGVRYDLAEAQALSAVLGGYQEGEDRPEPGIPRLSDFHPDEAWVPGDDE